MHRLEILASDADTVLPFRAAYSDPPRSIEAATSSGDLAPGSSHFAAYMKGQLVGVCSVGPEPLPILNRPNAWRGRGLAVRPDFRDRGIGPVLMQHMLKHVETKQNPYAWSYSKRRLLDLYALFGYRATGYIHTHHVSGETLLLGNEHTLRFIERSLGITYMDGAEPPPLGIVGQEETTIRRVHP